MADKYKSLKVKELQEILQKNGLPHTGKKEDLIDRLVKHDEKKTLELSSLDDLAGLDEFEESKLEDLDSLSELKSTEKKQDELIATETTTTTTTTMTETEKDNMVTKEQKETKTETISTEQPPAEIVKPGSNFKYTPISFGAPNTTATSTGTMSSELEKKIERAKRFNVDLDEKTKQQLRAERFGASAPKKQQQQQQQRAPQGKKTSVGIDAETLKKRAERFGLPSKEIEEDKKRKRAERFGIPTKEAEEEKKRRRAERFNTGK
ncbi:hypothetical protein BDA99DRAFT_519596 [Phascolomyces articulosus]|uniref:SAP domain-containing protein n=1 Tax=Phascolomyces articulosus TaxID=60185 RepID=A0AAD5JTP1_9FUNG|nr:hypothetical protein BDA99DRAFT_519596 [Phascolomyces articulosus]